jgi:hypothetical protein
MKIIYFIVTLIFMMRHSPCLRTTSNASFKSSSNPLLNFIHISTKKNANKKKSEVQDLKYHVKIFVIKQTDEKSDKPLENECQVALSEKSIDIYQNAVIRNQIPYLEYLFIN